MVTAIKTFGALSAAAWGSFFALMLVLTLDTDDGVSLVTLPFLVLPGVAAALAIWVAFRMKPQPAQVALAVEMFLLVGGAFAWLIVASASGG